LSSSVLNPTVQATSSSYQLTEKDPKLPQEVKQQLAHTNKYIMEQIAPLLCLFTSTAVLGYGVSKLLHFFNLPFIWKNRVDTASARHGGEVVAEVLQAHSVDTLYTLVGGHISPVLTAAEKRGMRVVDVRHEATTVFAADAHYRSVGSVGVAVVTAGPGITNTITALKNAQMAESAVLLLGGAAAGLLQGRGALQDIDQLVLVKSLCKYSKRVTSVRELAPVIREAIQAAMSGVPGPVFVELPIDVLYPYSVIAKEVVPPGPPPKSIKQKVVQWYLNNYLQNLFAGAWEEVDVTPLPLSVPLASHAQVERCAGLLRAAKRPVLVLGSQAAMARSAPGCDITSVATAVKKMGIPMFCGGMSRGIAGQSCPHQFRHARSAALKSADLIILAGAVCDFRLGYGKSLGRGAKVVAVNRGKEQLYKNSDMFWKPTLAVQGDPGQFLVDLGGSLGAGGAWEDWLEECRGREVAKEEANAQLALSPAGGRLNPLALLRTLEDLLPPEALLVVDGGDFVATAAYTLRPRAPLCWLDPGAFGTLGVGGGFALGAGVACPGKEVWMIYGDGALGFSLPEFDTLVRTGCRVVALVGNDAAWTQIAREQQPMLGSRVACDLRYTAYERAAEGLGAQGLSLKEGDDVKAVLLKARELAKEGPVLINAEIGSTSFRDGSISV